MSEFLTSYQQAVDFRPEQFNPVMIAENERVKVILASFEPGQFIPVHRPDVDLTLVILEGKGRLVTGKQEKEVGSGAMAFVPAGEARGLKAETKLVVLHVVTPPPTKADHVEVRRKLQNGLWP